MTPHGIDCPTLGSRCRESILQIAPEALRSIANALPKVPSVYLPRLLSTASKFNSRTLWDGDTEQERMDRSSACYGMLFAKEMQLSRNGIRS
jgi:hypothetical protein